MPLILHTPAAKLSAVCDHFFTVWPHGGRGSHSPCCCPTFDLCRPLWGPFGCRRGVASTPCHGATLKPRQWCAITCHPWFAVIQCGCISFLAISATGGTATPSPQLFIIPPATLFLVLMLPSKTLIRDKLEYQGNRAQFVVAKETLTHCRLPLF